MLRSTRVLAAVAVALPSPAAAGAATAGETAEQDGFDGAGQAVKGLPAGANAALALASVPASGSSALTVSTARRTPAGSNMSTV
jgi:hypothetical protein